MVTKNKNKQCHTQHISDNTPKHLCQRSQYTSVEDKITRMTKSLPNFFPVLKFFIKKKLKGGGDLIECIGGVVFTGC